MISNHEASHEEVEHESKSTDLVEVYELSIGWRNHHRIQFPHDEVLSETVAFIVVRWTMDAWSLRLI